MEARFKLGSVLAASERYEEALDEFLTVMKQQKDFQDGAARKAMLQIFEAWPCLLQSRIPAKFRDL